MNLDPADRLLLSGLATMASGGIAIALATASAPLIATAAVGTLAIGVVGVGLGVAAEFMSRTEQKALKDVYVEVKEIVDVMHDPRRALTERIVKAMMGDSTEVEESVDRFLGDLESPPTTRNPEPIGRSLPRRATPFLDSFAREILKDPESVPAQPDVTTCAADLRVDPKEARRGGSEVRLSYEALTLLGLDRDAYFGQVEKGRRDPLWCSPSDVGHDRDLGSGGSSETIRGGRMP